MQLPLAVAVARAAAAVATRGLELASSGLRISAEAMGGSGAASEKAPLSLLHATKRVEVKRSQHVRIQNGGDKRRNSIGRPKKIGQHGPSPLALILPPFNRED